MSLLSVVRRIKQSLCSIIMKRDAPIVMNDNVFGNIAYVPKHGEWCNEYYNKYIDANATLIETVAIRAGILGPSELQKDTFSIFLNEYAAAQNVIYDYVSNELSDNNCIWKSNHKRLTILNEALEVIVGQEYDGSCDIIIGYDMPGDDIFIPLRCYLYFEVQPGRIIPYKMDYVG